MKNYDTFRTESVLEILNVLYRSLETLIESVGYLANRETKNKAKKQDEVRKVC